MLDTVPGTEAVGLTRLTVHSGRERGNAQMLPRGKSDWGVIAGTVDLEGGLQKRVRQHLGHLIHPLNASCPQRSCHQKPPLCAFEIRCLLPVVVRGARGCAASGPCQEAEAMTPCCPASPVWQPLLTSVGLISSWGMFPSRHWPSSRAPGCGKPQCNPSGTASAVRGPRRGLWWPTPLVQIPALHLPVWL